MNLTVIILIVVLIPFMVYVASRLFFPSKLTPIWFSALSALLLYVAIVVSAGIHGQILKSDLQTYDLDGDGIFSGEEISLEQKEAMSRVTSDVGRNFAPITGGIFSVIYFFVVWFSCSITYKANSIYVRKNI